MSEPAAPATSTGHDSRPQQLWAALHRCPPLKAEGPERDGLWFAVRDAVCTRGLALVTPLGSTTEIVVSVEDSSVELIAAMEWLMANERQARRLKPSRLFVMLRGTATRGARGSGRAAQSDALHGMTEVPPGSPVRWCSLDEDGVA